MTLIDTSSHFEIHVSTASKLVSKLATYVHRAVFAGVKKANLTLGYISFTPSPSLLCPCGVGDPHVASFGEGVWICSKDNKIYGDFTPSQLIWQIQAENPSKQGMIVYIDGAECKLTVVVRAYGSPQYVWQKTSRVLGISYRWYFQIDGECV